MHCKLWVGFYVWIRRRGQVGLICCGDGPCEGLEKVQFSLVNLKKSIYARCGAPTQLKESLRLWRLGGTSNDFCIFLVAINCLGFGLSRAVWSPVTSTTIDLLISYSTRRRGWFYEGGDCRTQTQSVGLGRGCLVSSIRGHETTSKVFWISKPEDQGIIPSCTSWLRIRGPCKIWTWIRRGGS